MFKVEIPSDKPRSEGFREEVAHKAAKIEVPAFVANDEKAKEIEASVNKEANKAVEEEKKESTELETTEE